MSFNELPSDSEILAWNLATGNPNTARTNEMTQLIGTCLEYISDSDGFNVGESSRINIDPSIRFAVILRKPIEARLYLAYNQKNCEQVRLADCFELSHVSIDISKKEEPDGVFFNFDVCGHPSASRNRWYEFNFNPRDGHSFWVFDNELQQTEEAHLQNQRRSPYKLGVVFDKECLTYEIYAEHYSS